MEGLRQHGVSDGPDAQEPTTLILSESSPVCLFVHMHGFGV